MKWFHLDFPYTVSICLYLSDHPPLWTRQGASDGLDIGTQVQLWELVNQLVDGFASAESTQP